MIPARSGGGNMLICSGVIAMTRIIMAWEGFYEKSVTE